VDAEDVVMIGLDRPVHRSLEWWFTRAVDAAGEPVPALPPHRSRDRLAQILPGNTVKIT
jgi:hypothetical protein